MKLRNRIILMRVNRQLNRGSKAKAFYNSALNIVSDSVWSMFDYCVSETENEGKRIRDLGSKTKYILYFPSFQMGFLEKIMGYERV